MALRLLPIIALILAVLWLLRRTRRRPDTGQQTPAKATETLLRCRHCGLYITPDQALLDDKGDCYCSDHRDRRAGS